MLRWPQKALKSVSSLFRPLQDIDVYVEDEGSEAFYGELLTRLTGHRVRIARVLPLRGRDNVLSACEAFVLRDRPTLFLIDGDLYWVAGSPPARLPFLFQLEAYCIENFLLCEIAAIELAFESDGTLDRAQLRNRLGWTAWYEDTVPPLVELFKVLAVAFKLNYEKPLVEGLLGKVISPTAPGLPTLDAARVADVAREVLDDVVIKSGRAVVDREMEAIARRVELLNHPDRIISAKEITLPLLRFRLESLRRLGATKDAFKMRLAKHCEVAALNDLAKAIEAVARGTEFRQH